MKIAIVGAEASKWKNIQIPVLKIAQILTYHRLHQPTIISGRCPKGGVDIWVEQVNQETFDYPTEIYPPKFNTWPYYRERNIKIAESCDILYCISPKGVWNGGKWTLKYAEKIGKQVVDIEL